VGKTEGRNSVLRPRHRWENNVETGLKVIAGVDRDEWKAVVRKVMNLQVAHIVRDSLTSRGSSL
jgi:hypothetical protein